MLQDTFTLYFLSGVLAFIPAAIWLSVLFKRTKRKNIQILIFIGSIFSVVPVFLLQYFLKIFPQFNIVHFLQSNIENQNIDFILLFIAVGIVEEIVKQMLVRFVDRKYLLIQTINESIQFSLIGALGFSFAENIFYIFNIYNQLGIQQLFIPYLFRSIFTTCAHLIFSGFFGYYYGIAKFSLNIVEQSRWVGKKRRLITFIANKTGVSTFEAYKKITIAKGLLIAIIMHAAFNFFLQLNQILPVAIYVVISAYFLRRLLKQKTGHLIMITDASQERSSTMAQKDEDVVIELLGMWFNEKRFVDVIHICQRLLERDPGNKIIEIFKAKAFDKLNKDDVYGKILNNIFPPKQITSITEIAKKMKKQGISTVEPKPIQPEYEKEQNPTQPTSTPPDDKGTYELKI